jgi:hypothetical protein
LIASFNPSYRLRQLLAIETGIRGGRPLESCLQELGISAATYRLWRRDHGGQRFDLVTGEIQPWFTHLALDEIQEWDLHDKVVLEWGGGCSTLWWAGRCRWVLTVEADRSWYQWIVSEAQARGIDNITVIHRPLDLSAEEFTAVPVSCTPNIAIIDGPRRLSCLAKVLTLTRPLTVIFDNWQQDGAFVSSDAEVLMRPYPGIAYPQFAAGTPQHRRWQTAIWHLTF